MRSRFKRRLLKLRHLIKPTILVGVFFLVLFITLRFLFPIYQFTKEHNLTPHFFKAILIGKDLPIKKIGSRTNVVLLGISGGENEGADLTDTIILFSLDLQKKDAAMISIPRDIWIPSLKTKINSVYHYGEEKKKGGGFVLVKSAVSEVSGRSINYAILIDFSGFRRMIDLVGGIEIEVGRTFDDYFYPIPGKENDFCSGDPTFACRYEHVHFDNGVQIMNGEKALKYVRSRQAEGDEGTDFARSKRQQKVIVALKNKIFKKGLWKRLGKMQQLIYVFDKSVVTDMNWSEKIIFFKFFFEIPSQSIRHINLDTGDRKTEKNGLLVNPPVWKYGGIWVLEPRTGNFDEIHKYISCRLQDVNCQLEP